MPDITGYELPWNDTETTVAGWVTEVAELWHGPWTDPDGVLPFLPSTASPAERVEVITRIRPRLDRIEGIKAQLTIVKGRLRSMHLESERLAEEKWDNHNVQQRANVTRRGVEYEGPKERYADANLAAIAERRGLKSVERMQAHVDAAYEYVRVAQSSLEGMRSDQLAFYRGLSFEASLER